MSRVIIIGAGGVGNVVAKKCAQNDQVFSEVLIATRTVSKADRIVAEIHQHLPGSKTRFTTASVDADHVPALVELLNSFKPELVINVALPYQDLTIMDACLESGVHYLDTANYEPLDVAKFEYSWQWAYRERFEKAGLMALLGCGFDPGATGVFTTPSTTSKKSITSTSSTATTATTAKPLPPTSTRRSTSARSRPTGATTRTGSG